MEVRQPVPTGHVIVGQPQVVDAGAAPTAAAAPPASAPGPAPEEAGKKFDLPAGDAAVSLQAFARQSGEEIIFPVAQVSLVKLPGIHGELSTRAALQQLLAGSGLVAIQDEKTGAYVIRPAAPR